MTIGLMVAAPRSGSGKTLVTLGLLAALRARSVSVAPAKTGPDYIDAAILSRAAGHPAINLDPWAMTVPRLRQLAERHGRGRDLLLVEGVMGLFDGAADGSGSSADLAATLGLPVLFVVDAERQAHSVAPLVAGFAAWHPEVRLAGVILNRVASARHETMLRAALTRTGLACLGAVPRDAALAMPGRHLGLVLPDDFVGIDAMIAAAAAAVSAHIDLDAVLALARPIQAAPDQADEAAGLEPLGQHVAIARDAAFAFLYPHLLSGWREAGATLSFFSPLANEAPDPDCCAVFLPGGYPELHCARLAAASRFKAGVSHARDRGALIYGECGGFMVLGRSLADAKGAVHEMTGLLPLETRIDRPRLTLGYRRLTHGGQLPWPLRLRGHEFHYSTGAASGLAPLFAARDATGADTGPMGCVLGRVMGSYAHVIDVDGPGPGAPS